MLPDHRTITAAVGIFLLGLCGPDLQGLRLGLAAGAAVAAGRILGSSRGALAALLGTVGWWALAAVQGKAILRPAISYELLLPLAAWTVAWLTHRPRQAGRILIGAGSILTGGLLWLIRLGPLASLNRALLVGSLCLTAMVVLELRGIGISSLAPAAAMGLHLALAYPLFLLGASRIIGIESALQRGLLYPLPLLLLQLILVMRIERVIRRTGR